MTAAVPSLASLVLPDVDPLVHGMVITAFLIHALFMNLVVGGTIVTLSSDAFGHFTGRANYRELATTLSEWLPTFLGIAVVLGIFPLVLVQVLYGSILTPMMSLMGEFWIGAGLAALLGYGGMALYTHRREALLQRPTLQVMLGIANGILFLVVMFVFVLANVLLVNLDQWATIHNGSIWTIMSLPSLFPRFGHLVLAAIAGMGICLAIYGLFLSRKHQGNHGERPKEDYATWVIRYGVAWTLTGTLPQIVMGPWLLLSLPSFVRADLIHGQTVGSLAFYLGLTTSLLSLVFLNAALMIPYVRGFTIVGTMGLVMTVCFMTVVRHSVRVSWLAHQVESGGLGNEIQWSVLFPVGLVFLMGIGLMGMLLRVGRQKGMTSSKSP